MADVVDDDKDRYPEPEHEEHRSVRAAKKRAAKKPAKKTAKKKSKK